jgi:hypothetical protein
MHSLDKQEQKVKHDVNVLTKFYHVFVTKLVPFFLHLTKLKVNFNVSWIVNNEPKYVHEEGAVIAIS